MVRTENIYELRLFDRPLLLFSFGSEVPVRLLEWDECALPLMPTGLALTDEGLWKWLIRRRAEELAELPPVSRSRLKEAAGDTLQDGRLR